MSNSEANYDDVPPDASSMIESMRAYGYTMPAAIADLIDNSITAGAANVWVDMEWSGENSWVRVEDDGHGMTEGRLVEAMRLGASNPLHHRDPRDLGRFGLGMKTASLSQGRRMAVLSESKSAPPALRCWDLDYLSQSDIKGWQLLRTVDAECRARMARRHDGTGTVLVIDRLDRLVAGAVAGDQDLHGHFLHTIGAVETHLGMVFHRFLAAPRKPLHISVNGRAVEPWDPFLIDHGTETTATETIVLPGHVSPVRVHGYVLPHIDRIADDVHRRGAGPAGWNAQQGFYLYRNKRLILAGSWLGLGSVKPWTQEEHYKLARIQVDIPNSMDHLWHLDVKKSSAAPPPQLKPRLKALADTVRRRARDVYAHRGRRGSTTRKAASAGRPWKVGATAEGRSYRIDRQHPLVRSLRDGVPQSLRGKLDVLFRILEETIPVEQIWLEAAEHPDRRRNAFQTADGAELRRAVAIVAESVQHYRGVTPSEALIIVGDLEEFAGQDAQAIIAAMLEETR
jgi:hypothetical protein